jgi:predicted metal-dependent phosphoesterase TrpH
MKIDLHIHTSTGSDGNLPVEEVIEEARKRGLNLISITDHDSIDAQIKAFNLARDNGIAYLTGIELNVTFSYPGSKAISLDFLGYDFDIYNLPLRDKLRTIKKHREDRAKKILDRLNFEFDKEHITELTEKELDEIQAGVDGAIGRPHIADYLIKKGIVGTRQEAFDKYLVRCNVPKYPLPLSEASELIRKAGGVLVHAHPNDPNGTSLVSITTNLAEQTTIVEKYMMDYIDGIECWHSRHNEVTRTHYTEFCKQHNLLMTGGSDCHQKPILLGTVDVPDFVADQFPNRQK